MIFKIKLSLIIKALGLIGDFNLEIRKALIWAFQFEVDPIIRTEACHSLILLSSNKDYELIDLLLDRYLIEEESIVKEEIMEALVHLGYDPNKELPIVSKIKSDVKRLNDKNVIIKKIYEIEKQRNLEIEKRRLIWNEVDLESQCNYKGSQQDVSSDSSMNEMFGPFEPKLIEKTKNQIKNKSDKGKNFLNTSQLSKNNQKNRKKNGLQISNFLSKLVRSDSKSSSSLSSLNLDLNSLEDYSNENTNSISFIEKDFSLQQIIKGQKKGIENNDSFLASNCFEKIGKITEENE